ncbi:MAG TPA: hypothetical protein VGB09_06855, partial [Candidatus Binatia bacterium]
FAEFILSLAEGLSMTSGSLRRLRHSLIAEGGGLFGKMVLDKSASLMYQRASLIGWARSRKLPALIIRRRI